MFAGLGAGTARQRRLVDKLHKGKRPAAIPVAVTVSADGNQRAVLLQVSLLTASPCARMARCVPPCARPLAVALARSPRATTRDAPADDAVTIDDLPWNHKARGRASSRPPVADRRMLRLAAHRVPTVAASTRASWRRRPRTSARAHRTADAVGRRGPRARQPRLLAPRRQRPDRGGLSRRHRQGRRVTRELMRRRQPYVLYFRHPYTPRRPLEIGTLITRGLGRAATRHAAHHRELRWLFNVA